MECTDAYAEAMVGLYRCGKGVMLEPMLRILFALYFDRCRTTRDTNTHFL